MVWVQSVGVWANVFSFFPHCNLTLSCCADPVPEMIMVLQSLEQCQVFTRLLGNIAKSCNSVSTSPALLLCSLTHTKAQTSTPHTQNSELKDFGLGRKWYLSKLLLSCLSPTGKISVSQNLGNFLLKTTQILPRFGFQTIFPPIGVLVANFSRLNS